MGTQIRIILAVLTARVIAEIPATRAYSIESWSLCFEVGTSLLSGRGGEKADATA